MNDWSEVISTMPARMTKLKELLNDRKFDEADKLATDIEIDLAIVRQTISNLNVSFIKPKREEDLVPTMKLRWCLRSVYQNEHRLRVYQNEHRLQQWFVDRNAINPDGTPGGGRWVDIPVEIEQ